MERAVAFHLREHVHGSRPGAVPVVTPTNVTSDELEFPPFNPPQLAATRPLRWALVGSRGLMVGWAVVTAWRIHAASDDPVPRSPSGTVTAIGWLFVAIWFAAAARWSWVRTTNVHRLEGRYPNRTRAAVVWAYPAVWVLLMGVTFVPATPNPDFDYRPTVIVVGFVLAMMSGYRIVHRIFKSLVRMPPTATCVAFYLVDLMAFGLIWWRVTSWTGRDGIAPLDADLDLGILVAASVALAAGMVITWYLDRAADRGQEIRLLALRTRYDHRMARLNGLDPMNPQTRYALMIARRAAERAAQRPVDERTPDALAVDDPLVAALARELELGITPDFAARVRELERRTDGMMPTRAVPVEPRDESSNAHVPSEPRLWLAELVRYLVVGVYAGCAAASVVLVVEFRRGDADAVDAVRRVLHWGAAGVHVLVALWATRIAVDARRFGLPALWRIPAAALATSAVIVPLWFLVEVESDAAKLGLFTVLTLGLELALWRVTAIDWLVVYRESDSPLEAWMSMAPFVLGLVLLSPMRTELAPDVSSGRVAFFATLIGLAAALSGGLAAVAMVQLEDALRATRPGDRAAGAAGSDPAQADDTPPPVVERSIGSTRTPTAKPRSAGPPSPLRVDMTGMTAEIAAGLGFGPQANASRSHGAPSDEEPVVEEPVVGAPSDEEPVVEEPVVGAPSDEEPVVEEPVVEEPVVEVPVDAASTDEVSSDEARSPNKAMSDEPVPKKPVSFKAAPRKAVSNKPTTKKTTTRKPTTKKTTTRKPATRKPATDEPVSDEPVSDEPVTGKPAGDTVSRDAGADVAASESDPTTRAPEGANVSIAATSGKTPAESHPRDARNERSGTEQVPGESRDVPAESQHEGRGGTSGVGRRRAETADDAARNVGDESPPAEADAADVTEPEGSRDTVRSRRQRRGAAGADSGKRAVDRPRGDTRPIGAHADADDVLARIVARFGQVSEEAKSPRSVDLDADADDGRAHEDATDPVHEVEGPADRVGRLRELVDDPDRGEEDHDVAQPGDDPDEPAGPGER
jgi:hypothetical protein